MIYLYRIYQWVVAGPIFCVLTLLTALITIIGSMFGRSARAFWGYYPAMIWSRLTCNLFLMKVRVKGRKNIRKGQSYVFVANHQGAFDIWAIYGYLGHNFRWLMKKGLEKVFPIGIACKAAGMVFVDDSGPSGIRRTIQDAESQLRHGMSVVIFPEGSRSHDGRMIPFKRGAFMLAAEFRLPVVPLTIDGSFKAMPRSTYNMTPATITLVIHPPIFPPERGFNTKALMAECRTVINSALPDDLKDEQC